MDAATGIADNPPMHISQIKWSYSGLKDFQNCPKQYQEVKLLKRFSKKPTKQMLYGTEVHEALEHYVKDGTPLLPNYKRFQSMLDPLVSLDGNKFPEHKMALTADKVPCDFDAEDYWVRGIADLLVVDGNTAFVVDYKTGSNKYPDLKQLQLMALLTYEHFPEVNHVKAGLLFVMHNHFVASEYHRKDKDRHWNDFVSVLHRVSSCHQQNKWLPNPTPLCGWCPVSTCEFHKEK